MTHDKALHIFPNRIATLNDEERAINSKSSIFGCSVSIQYGVALGAKRMTQHRIAWVWPRELIYKRMHTGDPTPKGIFGLTDCMCRVRARNFDDVIGVGGRSAEPRSFDIDGRVTWIGVGARCQIIQDADLNAVRRFFALLLSLGMPGYHG